jgi:hypothetical protein
MVGRRHGAKRAFRWFASTIFDIRSRAVCALRAFPPRIAKHCSATPITRWPVITRVPTSAICSNRRISYSREAAHRPCYACRTVTRDRSRESNSKEEDLVLRAKCMNRDASMGTSGQLAPQRSYSRQEDLVFAAKSCALPERRVTVQQNPRVRQRSIDDLAIACPLQAELANMNCIVTIPPQELDGPR